MIASFRLNKNYSVIKVTRSNAEPVVCVTDGASNGHFVRRAVISTR